MDRELHVPVAPAPYVPRVRPFHHVVDQAVLDDLHDRLARTRWAPPLSRGWSQGTDPAYLHALVDYWRDRFDWRAEEARLGQLPQYLADVDGAELHFVHLTTSGLPIVLLHGWPDSFHRYHAVAPALAREGFEVVVPSLPGFVFSPPLRPAQPLRRIANLVFRLMTDVLGHARFGVAGGDLGSAIAQILAIEHPEVVVGIHLTDLGREVAVANPGAMSWAEQRHVERRNRALRMMGAYALVETTRPRSLAVGLGDSPVALASWIVDRFHAGSDGDLDARFGKDTLLANIMLYWVTQSIGSSLATFGAEAASPSLAASDHVGVPVGFAACPHAIGGIVPRRYAERVLAVTQWTALPRGGYVVPLEEPALYTRDVATFFRSI